MGRNVPNPGKGIYDMEDGNKGTANATDALIEAIKGSDYICEELIPQCISWREVRHLLELDGLTALGGVYIHSLDLDQKRLDDELIGYNR